MGARVEISLQPLQSAAYLSLPSWERGLKFVHNQVTTSDFLVAPLVGARVEIEQNPVLDMDSSVAPLVGARVEIGTHIPIFGPLYVAPLVGARVEINAPVKESSIKASLPSWERGLKLQSFC